MPTQSTDVQSMTNLDGISLVESSSFLSVGAASIATTTGVTASAPEEWDERQLTTQLESLQETLRVENRIKDGAENLLSMDLDDALRGQVQSELNTARKKIEAIRDDIEAYTRALARQRGSPPARRGVLQRGDSLRKVDDFRTALKNATNMVKTLSSLNLKPASGSAPSSPTSIAASLSPPVDESIPTSKAELISRLTTILQTNVRVRYELNINDLLQAVLPCLGDRSTKYCRAMTYRLIRHALIDIETVKKLREHPIDWYIVKSLSRDNKFSVEKEQVIKLIRAIVQIGAEHRTPYHAAVASRVPICEPVIRAFIAVAEHADEPFRQICILTLAEILMIDIDLLARCGGLRVLLHSLAEAPGELTHLLASTFLYIVDLPRTRGYLRPGSDLEIALTGVTDAYGRGLEYSDRVRACTRVVAMMLRTWSGLIYFCMDDMKAIKTVIDTLRIPSLETREIVLDMFFDLLNIKPPDWYQTFIDGRRLTMYRRNPKEKKEPKEPKEPDTAQKQQQSTLKVTDQYIALLIRVFVAAGLLDALSSMCEENIIGTNLSRKATLLMAEVLHMGNKVLSLSAAAKIQMVPRIFALAADYNDGEHRIVGTSALSAIDSFNRNRSKLEPATNVKDSRPRANSEDAVRRGQRQVEQVKIKMGMQMDGEAFRATLLETHVMLTKDHTKWNFDTLLDLIEGPLLNPKRMEEAIKVSRFTRRLTSFFHPFSHRFSDLPRGKGNAKWVKLGCAMLTTLLASPEGVRLLSTEDEFLPQIRASFAQLDPFNGFPPSDPILSKRRIAETLTYGYLEMLGTLSKHKEGIELLEKFKIFTAFYHLSELRSREDLMKLIIENLDYSTDGHPRIVLSKALTSSYKHIRSYATKHLGELVRASPIANSWTLRLLLTQLYDPAVEVRGLAVTFLREACEVNDVLHVVVEMQPMLDHLGDIGHPLLLKFMSTPVGFRYLYSADYIDREMDVWFNTRNVHYVVEIEIFLARAFNFNFNSGERDDDVPVFDGIVPPHFYGVMAKTELGCQVLHQKGHFSEFAQFIKKHGLEQEDPDIILKLKSILWAVGNIGATEGGLPFLEEEEVIPDILNIAEKSQVLSVRGWGRGVAAILRLRPDEYPSFPLRTCFFALGLVSSTPQGAEILEDYGWEATLSPLGLPTGLCIPASIEKFLSIPSWEVTHPKETSMRLKPPMSENEVEVMTAVSNLANTVIANTASRALAKMKGRPEFRRIFSSPQLFYRVLHTISTQKYRLLVRRYIFDLFNVEMDEETMRAFAVCERTLRVDQAPDHTTTSLQRNPSKVISSFGHHSIDSDESAEDEVSEAKGSTRKFNTSRRPVSLKPTKKIVGGFD
ncbi:Rapamycin-insensitive companion of mTOR, N-term-domain-containing protein [Thelephora terrestris]|uniref:Rapamycin-insensitive companion of mTOR, N-term-domain-containing protein n=1 Tax=Thelephora terrestris TaxID=56493 RepID=A0A9P6H8A5_9AGAM|nr:Rapamycin-insensitive companion of mTOR, N-term-domain-containing protein [Thelephora terrestris]